MRQFSYKIKAGNLENDRVKLGLLSGHYNTEKVVVDQSAEAPYTATAEIVYTNASEARKAGYDTDVMLDDGMIAPNLEAISLIGRYTIRAFLSWAKDFEPVVNSMTISANNTQVFERNILYQRVSPSGNGPERYIMLKDYYKTDQFNPDKIVVNFLEHKEKPLEFFKDAYMDMEILSNDEITFTYKFV